MGKGFRLIAFLLILGLLSCAQKANVKTTERPQLESLEEPVETATNSPAIAEPPPPLLPPTYREIDPLEDKKFTFSAVDAPLTKVLYAIAEDAGLNLVISPEVNLNRTITATFRNTSIKDALEVVMELSGLDYQLKGNVLFVREIITKTFKLPYVNTQTSYTSSLGGSATAGQGGGVAGAAGGGGASTSGTSIGGGIGGSFQLEFSSPQEQGGFYEQLEQNLQSLLDTENGESYVLNKFTGTLVVRARKRTMESVEKLIKRIKKEVRKQVLIEAKIVEVILSDSSSYGLDWNRLLLNILGSRINAELSQASNFNGGFFTLRVSAYQFSAILRAISEYGKAKILANPRIMTVNGQPALITAGVSIPFFRREAQAVFGGAANVQTVNIYVDSVLHGVMLGVVPYVEDNNEVLLNIIPISSRLQGERRFPETGQELATAPILNVKEMGTIVKVKDGELVVIGGLIDSTSVESDTGTPIAKDVPVLGKVFKSESKRREMRELVIFLRPTIVGAGER